MQKLLSVALCFLSVNALATEQLPFFLLYGDNDIVVPHNGNALLIENAYKMLGGPAEVKVVPGAGHTGGDFYFKEQALADFALKVAEQIGVDAEENGTDAVSSVRIAFTC